VALFRGFYTFYTFVIMKAVSLATCAMLASLSGAEGEIGAGEGKLMEYLLGDNYSSELTMTHALASRMDRKSLEGLAEQTVGSIILVLPTDEAWKSFGFDLYEKLMEDSSRAVKWRSDMLFSAGGEIESVGGFESLLAYAEGNGGVVDTAYGTPMKIEPDGRACIAEYDQDWNLLPSECTTLRLPPLIFEDGSLYLTNTIIMPDTLKSEMDLQPLN